MFYLGAIKNDFYSILVFVLQAYDNARQARLACRTCFLLQHATYGVHPMEQPDLLGCIFGELQTSLCLLGWDSGQ